MATETFCLANLPDVPANEPWDWIGPPPDICSCCARCGSPYMNALQAIACPNRTHCKAARMAYVARAVARARGLLYAWGTVQVRLLRSTGFELERVRDLPVNYPPHHVKEGRLWGPRAAVRVALHGPPFARVGLVHENVLDYPEALKRHFEDREGPLPVLSVKNPVAMRHWTTVRRALLADLRVDPGMCVRIEAMDALAFEEVISEWWVHTPRVLGRKR